MKTSLEHLPPNKQEKVRAIAKLIREAAPVDMIILYGSLARGDWVDDPVGGYVSDYDVAVIVKNSKLANKPELWSNVEQNAQRLAGPTAAAEDACRFKLLERAYVDARYSMSYRITREELDWLAARA